MQVLCCNVHASVEELRHTAVAWCLIFDAMQAAVTALGILIQHVLMAIALQNFKSWQAGSTVA